MKYEHDSKQEQSVENKEVSSEGKNNSESGTVTSQQLEEKVQECQQELSYWKDQCLRIAADFENFKKRLEKERTQVTGIIKGNVLSDLLPVVDNFERALSLEQKTDNIQSVLQGFEMIYKDLCKMLEKQGVTQIGFEKSFNPELHEAVMSVSSDQHNSGEIVEILQKGYMLDGQVLRPAKVSVAV